ncbi:hypothetical protein D3C78_1876930 [compost metagenome]
MLKAARKFKARMADLRLDVEDGVMPLCYDRELRLDFSAALVAIYVNQGRVLLCMKREADIYHE